MLLAAGLGTRMTPLARACAKPALPVLDVPVILRLVRALAARGVERAIVNTHVHPESLREALRDSPLPIDWVHEPAPRGSGGGILGARHLLGDSAPFLVVNGDMCLELDFAALVEHHRKSGALATLVLRDDSRKREFGSIGYDRDGHVCRITERIDVGREKACGLFVGVQVMSPVIFARMPERASFEIIPDVYVPALRSGSAIGTWLQPEAETWWPVGTPRELLDANLSALGDSLRVHPSAQVAGEVIGPAWIGAAARVARGARVGPHGVVSAGAAIAESARLERSLALPGAEVARGAALERAIAYGDEVWRDD
jgi:mannose-1-phosphate guanylyltransferase/phosphomannomutase